MLVKLEVDQALKRWDVIKPAIILAQPVGTVWDAAAEARLVEAVSMGALIVWAEQDAQGIVQGIVTTLITEDIASGTKGLLVYSTTAFNKLSGETWREGIETVCRYAQAKGCKKLMAYTSNPTMLHIAEKFGMNTDLRLVILEV